ncbi:hypothetical protein C3489_18715 [Streptomyces sp. Ru71]|uniref:DUF6059 family protein n=1 Tax=Streptomyces sp. Ru71 TaxID=2080746 RepID=UPI000CDD9696|nr:DUF6059 family protein [Streptomyces sp. Ru71]POX51985.1 hypothetical protein C3489_18715 [Streptomyces sp. Ru71]
MRRWRGGGLWALACSCGRRLHRSLAALGAGYAGPAVYCQALLAPSPAAHLGDPVTPRDAAAPGLTGPPPGHPERLCAERPLSVQERRLARDMWPAHYRD